MQEVKIFDHHRRILILSGQLAERVGTRVTSGSRPLGAAAINDAAGHGKMRAGNTTKRASLRWPAISRREENTMSCVDFFAPLCSGVSLWAGTELATERRPGLPFARAEPVRAGSRAAPALR